MTQRQRSLIDPPWWARQLRAILTTFGRDLRYHANVHPDGRRTLRRLEIRRRATA